MFAMEQTGMMQAMQDTFKMEFNKIGKDTIEQTFKTTVFKADLLSEKETLEARLKEVNAQLVLLG